MKSMQTKIKSIMILTACMLCSTIMILAQPPQNRGQRMTVEERAKRTTEWMTTELKLSQEQINPVDSINLLFARAQQSYFQSVDGDRDKIREAMVTLETEKEAALAKVLTPEQLETYKAKVKEMASQRSGNRGGNRDRQ